MADNFLDTMAGFGTFVSDLASPVLNWMGIQTTNQRNEALMRESWARDDTAMQRKVADLAAAGLNPVLAAGGSGSPNSGPISLKPPSISPTDFSNVYAAAITSKQNQVLASQAARAATEATSAEIQLNQLAAEANLSIAKAKELMPYAGGLAKAQVDQVNYATAAAEAAARQAIAEASIRMHDAAILEKNPELLSTSSGWVRDLMGGMGMLGGVLDKVSKYQFKPTN